MYCPEGSAKMVATFCFLISLYTYPHNESVDK